MPRASLDRALRATNDPSGGLSGFGNLDAAMSLSPGRAPQLSD